MSRVTYGVRKHHKQPMTLAEWQEFAAKMKDAALRINALYFQLSSHEAIKESDKLLSLLRSMNKARTKICHTMARDHGWDAADDSFWGGGWPS